MHNELIEYLTELGRKPLSPEQQDEQMRLVKMADELEHIGDVLETNISRLIEQKQESKVNFDAESTKLLSEYHAMTLEALEKTVVALDSERAVCRTCHRNEEKVEGLCGESPFSGGQKIGNNGRWGFTGLSIRGGYD